MTASKPVPRYVGDRYCTPLWFWEVGAKKWKQRGIGDEAEAGGAVLDEFLRTLVRGIADESTVSEENLELWAAQREGERKSSRRTAFAGSQAEQEDESFRKH